MPKIKMNQNKSDSFTVTLQSNLCTDVYPHNNNYRFRNKLPYEVNVKGFEVGLVDLYYYDTYQRPRNRDEIQIQPSDNTPFFDLLFSENEVTILDSSSVNLLVTKYYNEISRWIVAFNKDLEKFKFYTHISSTLDAGILKGVVIEFYPPDDSKLILSEPFKQFLGFTSTILEKGEHPSDGEVDLEFFKSLERLDTMGYIRREKLTTSTVEIEQVYGKPAVNDLAIYISTALGLEGHNVSMYSKDDVKLEYSIEPKSKRFILSKFLNNYLGLPDYFYFQGEGSINVPPAIVDPVSREVFLLDTQSSSKILVTTDIIGSQFYGKKQLPILAVLNRINNKDSEVQHKMNPMVYKEVERERLSEIEISIRSDTGEYTSFSRNPTTLTLHFRKVKA